MALPFEELRMLRVGRKFTRKKQYVPAVYGLRPLVPATPRGFQPVIGPASRWITLVPVVRQGLPYDRNPAILLLVNCSTQPHAMLAALRIIQPIAVIGKELSVHLKLSFFLRRKFAGKRIVPFGRLHGLAYYTRFLCVVMEYRNGECRFRK